METELTILMPCLNEAETLATCVRKAFAFLSQHSFFGEVLVADNGSTDGSRAIAVSEGARLVPVEQRGYGAALLGGIAAAKGKYVIIGDADDSYDFSDLMSFVVNLREGADLVVGNRFKGRIEPGAMPFLHRYLGNPFLSWLGCRFSGINVRDFHCGLRGFNRNKILDLNLRTTGMEFASEMVVRAAFDGLRIEEVPTTLRADGRSRPSHLRTWRDGWRHLSFLVINSPRRLFLYPSLLLLLAGIISAVVPLPAHISIEGIGFDIHRLVVAGSLVGVVMFGLIWTPPDCNEFVVAIELGWRATPVEGETADQWRTLGLQTPTRAVKNDLPLVALATSVLERLE
jgi:glycosyltransferase involved in cell wall biosynthesis